ncbi:hypothetical protein [Streptomyces sp. st170]|uniref:hypothetical protein n=1 Tax=Streptomyces sp. st170 TaxID=1828058 RepID=UPI00117D55A7|nr:hypothetical protein [Streptomyces sp. st170]
MNLEDAADLGTALAAIATLVLVGFGVRQLIALQKQVELGQQATDAAVTAAEAAQRAVLETARTRIDEQVARLVVISEDPQWPPLRNPLISSMPAGDESRLFDSLTLHGSPEVGTDDLIFPQDANQLMWFVVRGVVTNEGRSTARIRLDGEGRFIEGTSNLIPGEHVEVPPVVGGWQGNPSYLFTEHLLRPGKSALFEWAAGCTIAEWAELHDQPTPAGGFIYLKAFDSAEHGVVDSVKVEVQGRPLQPVPQRDGHWALSSPQHRHMGVVVWPTQREYRSEVSPGE